MLSKSEQLNCILAIINLGLYEMSRWLTAKYRASLEEVPPDQLILISHQIGDMFQGKGFSIDSSLGISLETQKAILDNPYIKAIRYINTLIQGKASHLSMASFEKPIELAEEFTQYNFERTDIPENIVIELLDYFSGFSALGKLITTPGYDPTQPIRWNADLRQLERFEPAVLSDDQAPDASEVYEDEIDLAALCERVLLPLLNIGANKMNDQGEIQFDGDTELVFICEACSTLLLVKERYKQANHCQSCQRDFERIEQEYADLDDGFEGHYAGSDWE